jgi:hypothetical protein
MSYDVSLSIKYLQEAQAKNNKAIAALKPSGEFGRVVRDVTIYAHRHGVAITHVDTGTLKAGHRMQVRGLRGRIYIDPGAINPRSHQRAAVYGIYEHERGGEHAFYDRVGREVGPEIERRYSQYLVRAVTY